jgi:hypothetical protein
MRLAESTVSQRPPEKVWDLGFPNPVDAISLVCVRSTYSFPMLIFLTSSRCATT